jgi:hypothetical protein
LPDDTVEAYVEIFASGNSAEEFWYSSELVYCFGDSFASMAIGIWDESNYLEQTRLMNFSHSFPNPLG